MFGPFFVYFFNLTHSVDCFDVVQFHLVFLDLILDVIADLQFFFQFSQTATSVEEKGYRFFKSLFIVWRCGNMNFSFRKDRILCVHEFIEKDAQRVSIVPGTSGAWLLLELFVVKIRNIGFID